jgi:hypothetical protein
MIKLADKNNEITALKNEDVLEYVRTGDVSSMSPKQKNSIIVAMCEHLNISPALKPIDIIPQGGKEVLYVNSTGTSLIAQSKNLTRSLGELVFLGEGTIAMLKAKVSCGERYEEGYGVVTISKFQGGKFVKQQGEELANTLMKLQTKAMRRATLAFVGASDLNLDHDIESKIKVTSEQEEVPSLVSTVTEKSKKIKEENVQDVEIQEPALVTDVEPKNVIEPKRSEDKKEKDVKEEPKKTKKRAVRKTENKEEKIARGKEMLKENEQKSKKIKEEYSFDFEEEKSEEDVIEYDLFDARNKEHISLFIDIVNMITGGPSWKQDEKTTTFVKSELLPQLNKKEMFVEKGTKDVIQSFIDRVRSFFN